MLLAPASARSAALPPAVTSPIAYIGGTDLYTPSALDDALTYDATGVTTGHQATGVLSADGKTLDIFDPGVHILARSPYCTGGVGHAKCRGDDIYRIAVQLGPGNDEWTMRSPAGRWFSDDVHGGAGADVLRGSLSSSDLSGDAGDDTLIFRGAVYSFGRGGDGNDVLAGSPIGASNSLSGDAGDDSLTGSAAPDDLNGGPGEDRLTALAGNDRLEPGPGTDEVDGGAGVDVLSYFDIRDAPVAVSLDDGVAGDGDALDSIEDVEGSSAGPDRLVGDDGPNRLTPAGREAYADGRGGNDRLTGDGTLLGGAGDDTMTIGSGTADGGDGDDEITFVTYGHYCEKYGCHDPVYATTSVSGGTGDDVLKGAMQTFGPDREPDLGPDTITCGDGWDTVVADLEDDVAPDCEAVTRR